VELKLSLDTYDWLYNVSQANRLFGRVMLDFDDRLKERSAQIILASSRTHGIPWHFRFSGFTSSFFKRSFLFLLI
jgi:hypothetical protein